LPKQFNVNEPSDDEESEEEDEKKGRAKPDTALKPDKLTTDFTPDEFREWREQWYSYFEASNFEAVSERCQQQYLKACLNTNLKLRLSEKCNKDTPIFGADDSCMAYLQQEFDAQYPLQNRRLEFFHYKQQSGQLMSDFALKLKRLWEQADIHKIDPEELLVYRYMTGCTDQKLRNELLKIEDPTVILLNDRIMQWERERKQEKKIQASMDRRLLPTLWQNRSLFKRL